VGGGLRNKKAELYKKLAADVRNVLEGERDLIANAANLAAMIYEALPEVNWAGFYFLKGDELVLGPFQGKPACTRIALGRGVCGTAAEKRQTLVVENVHEFPGHIACNTESNSEIVVPIIKHQKLVGVLDLDSPMLARFDASDQAGLEELVAIFAETTQ